MITDNLVVNGLIKVTSQAEVNNLTVDQVNDVSGEDISQLSGTTDNVQEQINALATSYEESIENSTEFKTEVANAVNSLSDEPNLNSESTLEQYVAAISLLGGKNYKGRLTASDDLDNVSDDGFYDIVLDDQPINIPGDCGSMNACVEVFNLPEIETIYQRYHKFQGGVFTYSRRKFNGVWSDWVAYTFGVKGNAETSYRSGNVNITPENIGATPNYSYTIDLSNTSTYLESNWYPVVGNAIPGTGMHHIKLHVHLDSGTKPSWSTHDRGFSCNMDLRVKAAGWGTTMHHSICLEYDCLWCQDNINPCGYTQLTTASFPVLWLRGGGKYFVETDYKCEWSPKSSTYTVNSDSVSPATSCPGIQFNRSTVYANLDGSVNGNASSATKLQTTRTIFGKSFDGSANIGGKALVHGTYVSDASSRFCYGALEIRENGLVGSAQSDFGYAPSIGFHWSGRVAATLSMHTDGIFYFRKQDGTTRATIDANVKGNIYNSTIDSSNKVNLGTTALSGYTSPLTPQYTNYMANGPVSIVDYLLTLGNAIDGICSDAIPKAGTSNISGNLIFSNSNSTTLTGTSLRGLYGVVGDNDGWRIAGGGSSNEGFLEIATCDDASEPIYVRQYSNGGGGLGYANLARTLTLLDSSGNTSIPGNLSVGGSVSVGPLTVSGRVANNGDDEGILVSPASNGWSALVLGTTSGRRSYFAMSSSDAPIWRYSSDGITNWVITHPCMSGTIALKEYTLSTSGGTVNGDVTINGSIALPSQCSIRIDSSSGPPRILLGSSGTSVSGDLSPTIDAKAAYTVGTSSKRWKTVYASSSTIVTSDRNQKDDIENLSIKKAQNLILNLKPSTYKMKDGESGRTHWGLIAQDIEEVLDKIGITSLDFAGFIKSPKTEIVKIVGEDGEETCEERIVEGEYLYSLRYEEFISPLIKLVQDLSSRVQHLENEIEFLKNS